MSSLLQKIENRSSGICLYGVAPPKLSTPPERLAEILAQQQARFAGLPVDGLVVYDIQDEQVRSAEPRPFPFLPTLDPEDYAHVHLQAVRLPKVVYRAVQRTSSEGFVQWLKGDPRGNTPRFSVLVGAAKAPLHQGLKLEDAYALARERAPNLTLGGIAIAERHARKLDEHQRILGKMQQGCRFFITQAVYDATSTKSLLSDYALALRQQELEPVPLILTFSPCGSPKTLEFMKWLGIAVPRWLENDLRHSADILEQSIRFCDRIFAEVLDYAREKRLPLGINVESISIRKPEIDASVELLRVLGARLST